MVAGRSTSFHISMPTNIYTTRYDLRGCVRFVRIDNIVPSILLQPICQFHMRFFFQAICCFNESNFARGASNPLLIYILNLNTIVSQMKCIECQT